MRRSGWKPLQSKRANKFGQVSFDLRLGKHGKTSYRLVFTPRKKNTDYVVSAERRFSVTYTPPTPARKAPVVRLREGVVVKIPETKSTPHNLPCALLACPN